MISQNEGKKAENSSKYCWDSTQMSTYGMTPLIGTSRKARLISDRVRISGYLCKGEGTFQGDGESLYLDMGVDYNCGCVCQNYNKIYALH